MGLTVQDEKRRAEIPAHAKTLVRAFEILEAFDDETPELGIRELSRKLGEPKSSVQRLVATLVHLGVLERDPASERFRIGFKLFDLGSRWLRNIPAHDRIHQHLLRLVEETKETAYLAIPDNDGNVVYIDKVLSPQAIRAGAAIGQRASLAGSAIGRAILAYMPNETIDEVLRRPLEPRTPNSITDPERLRHLLAESTQAGFFLDDEESEIGLRCIAVPVLTPDSVAQAAICISGPSSRITHERVHEIAESVKRAAADASKELIYLLAQDGPLR